MQEGRRKDVERCFGMIQSRWQIIRKPSQLWDAFAMKSIITACVILHNMIIEDEMDPNMLDAEDLDPSEDAFVVLPNVNGAPDPLAAGRFLQCVGDKTVHRQLQTDLIEHLWEKYDDEEH